MAEIDNGGYDVEFVEKINMDDIKCAICLLTLREPMQANPCGHRFCKSCIDQIPKQGLGIDLVCPSDRRNIKVFPDIGKEREILNLKVKCTSHELSCVWTGELRDLEKHLPDCVHAIHPCKYSDMGCQTKGNRRFLLDHLKEDIDEHMSHHRNQINKQTDLIKQQEAKMVQQGELIAQQGEMMVNLMKEIKLLSSFFPKCPFTFVIDNFAAKFKSSKKNNDIIYSDPFYYLNGYRARLKIYLNGRNTVQGTHMSVYFQILKGPLDSTLKWPMVFGLIKISLMINDKYKQKLALNCKEDEEDLKNRFVKPTKDEGDSYGPVKYFPHESIPTDIHGDMIKLIVDVTQL